MNETGKTIVKYLLKIEPSIPPIDRHKIEDALTLSGYNVHGGGQATDGTFSDITFDNK